MQVKFLKKMISDTKLKEALLRMIYMIVGWGILAVLTMKSDTRIISPEFLFMAFAILVANCLPLELGFAQVTQAFAFEYIALIMLGPAHAAWIAVIGIIGQGVFSKIRRYDWYVLNSSIQIISIVVTGLVFYSLGGKNLIDSGVNTLNPMFLLPVFAGAITHFCLNIGMIYPFIVLRQGKNVNYQDVWNVFQWDFVAKMIFAPLAFYICITYRNTSINDLIYPILFIIALWVFVRKSMQLSMTKRELHVQIEQINTQREIAKAANSSLDMQHVIETVADRLNGLYVCEMSIVHLKDAKGELKRSTVIKGELDCESPLGDDGKNFTKLLNRVLEKNLPYVTSSIPSIQSLIESASQNNKKDCTIGSIAIYPLRTSSEKFGTITFISKEPEHFQNISQKMIDFLAQELSGAIANARLHEDLKHENNLRSEELNYASRIQAGILPHDFMTERVIIRTKFTAAHYLGGDFFEISPRSDGQIAIAVGDVSGKGVAAALTMMRIISILRQFSRNSQSSIEVLNQLNRELDWEDAEDDDVTQYATCFFLLFNPMSGLMWYSSAGHVRPILFRKKTADIKMLGGGGFPLGMFTEGNFNEDCIQLAPGDKVVLYTDGATDVVNDNDIRFSLESFKEIVLKICKKKDEKTADGIHAEIMKYRGDIPLADDVAIVSLEFLGGPIEEDKEMEAMIEKTLPVISD